MPRSSICFNNSSHVMTPSLADAYDSASNPEHAKQLQFTSLPAGTSLLAELQSIGSIPEATVRMADHQRFRLQGETMPFFFPRTPFSFQSSPCFYKTPSEMKGEKRVNQLVLSDYTSVFPSVVEEAQTGQAPTSLHICMHIGDSSILMARAASFFPKACRKSAEVVNIQLF